MADIFEAEEERIRKLKNDLDKLKEDMLYVGYNLNRLKVYSDPPEKDNPEVIGCNPYLFKLQKYEEYQKHLNSAKNLIKREKELKYEIELAESYLKSQKENYRQVKVLFFIIASLLLLFISFRFIK